MDATRFDRLTRSITNASSRRGLLGGFAATLGLSAIRFPKPVEARKKRKNKNRKKAPAFNQFGCLNVGQKCGNSDNCCSGICQGKKPKKGEKDKGRCVAHDTGGCQAGEPANICDDSNIACISGTGSPGACATTTGNAGYCVGNNGAEGCTRDADCQAEFGSRAACVVCATATGGTSCVGPDNVV